MKKILPFFALASLATLFPAFGERSLAPGLEAFNACVAADAKDSFAFSPFSFELDCWMMGEALDPIGRANVSEKLAVMSDPTIAYGPILDAFEQAPATNRVFFLSARTIGVSDVSKVNADFRRRVFEMRGNASISQLWPTLGAERWLSAKLDGWMDDFTMPIVKVNSTDYTLVDAAAVAAYIPEGTGCFTKNSRFRKLDGSDAVIPFLNFRANADFIRRDDYISVRVGLRGDAFLYIMLPNGKKTLADVRKHIVPDRIKTLLLEVLDKDEKGNGSSMCELSIPQIDTTSKTLLEPAFSVLGIPEGDITYLYSQLKKRTSLQCTRFLLDQGEQPQADEAANTKPLQSRAMFNRPFIYFIYLPEYNAIPVIGQFTGQDPQ